MQLELKKAIEKYIKDKDPNGDVVIRIAPSRDWKTGEVHYNWQNLVKGCDCGLWNDASENGAEELVRAYLLVRLTKELRYPLDKSITLEKPYSIGHQSRKPARLDVCVGDRRDLTQEKSFMLIECKSPEKYEQEYTDAIKNQLFLLAPQEQISNNRPVRYLGYYTIRWVNGEIREEVELIDFEQYQNWDAWDTASQPPASRFIPASYGIAFTSVYVNKPFDQLQLGESLLDDTKYRDFFQRLQKDLHNKLWGGSTEYNYVFKNLSRLLLAKIYDEFTTPNSNTDPPRYTYRFQVYQKTDPDTQKQVNESPQEIFERINQLVKDSAELIGYSQEEKRNYGIEVDYVDANKVAYVVNQLEGISVVNNIHARTGDILGDFFEGIISEGFKQDRGTFFTHKNIVYFILYGLCIDDLVKQLTTHPVDPRTPYFCDPACGSGTFLVEGMKLVTKHLPKTKIGQPLKVQWEIDSWSTEAKTHLWAGHSVYGIDANPDLALSAKVNMVLHLDGNLNIFKSDALKPFFNFERTHLEKNGRNLLLASQEDKSAPYPYEVNEQFDVIMSNPPFSIPLDPETKKAHRGRFLFAETRNSEVLFLERYYQLLKPNGRMGVVLPESIFDTAENLSIRLFLYRHFEIWGIVSLPYLAFNPFTSTKTCLLFARKKTRDEEVAFDIKWKEAAVQYKKLRNHPLIQWAIENKKLHTKLMNFCVHLDYDYQPQQNMLYPNILDIKGDLIATVYRDALPKEWDTQEIAEWLKSIDNLFEKIDNHFTEAPFDHIRVESQKWQEQNFQMLTQVTNFASSVDERFTPDRGHLTPNCFSPDVCARIAEAAKVMDTKSQRKTTKNQKAWAKLYKDIYKYFAKFVTLDLSNDPEARQVIERFLKSLLDQNDHNLSLLALINKYLDDIESVGEINDMFGKFPGKEKPEPFAYANAWWVFGEVMEDTAFRYGVFLAEAEEIGYKRGKGNRYQPRRNDLFRCDDPNDLLNTIHPDDTGTILGCLREHIRKKKAHKQPTIVCGFVTESLNIAGQLSLRPDPKYRFFWDIQRGISLPEAITPQIRLRDCLLPYAPRMIPKGELEEERQILELADVESRTSIVLLDKEGNERTVTQVGSIKVDFANCDFVFNRLEPYLGKILVNDPTQAWIGTSEWIPFKVRQSLILPVFLKWLLLCPNFLNQNGTFWKLRSGKRHARLTESELKRIWIPLVDPSRQEKLSKLLTELELELIEKHRSLTSRIEVIDTIFADEFNYTLDDYQAKAANSTYERSINEFERSLDLRGGVRFHHPKFDPLDTMFTNVERCLFREVVIPFVRLGATIHPEDFDEDGEAYYISPAVIKTYTCDLNTAQTLTHSYYRSNWQQFGLRENDLVIARSGEGTIGKAALFTDDIPSIYSDFTMRVRFNQRMLPEFGYYFCCSKLFHLQVEKLKRGMGNMTNFFPGQLLRFWIACPSPERQKDIVERVRIALDEFDAQRDEVERLRNEIDAVVLRSLMIDETTNLQ